MTKHHVNVHEAGAYRQARSKALEMLGDLALKAEFQINPVEFVPVWLQTADDPNSPDTNR